jgi:hypothetical protein
MNKALAACVCLALAACAPDSSTTTVVVPKGPPQAPQHTLLGIEFGKPLKLPECGENEYDVKQKCMMPSTYEEFKYQIKFPIADAPRFVDSDKEIDVGIDAKTGNVDSVKFDVGDGAYDRDLTDSALVEKFGPQTDSPDEANTDSWHWEFADYYITYFRNPPYRSVQMWTTEAYHRTLSKEAAQDAAEKAKL